MHRYTCTKKTRLPSLATPPPPPPANQIQATANRVRFTSYLAASDVDSCREIIVVVTILFACRLCFAGRQRLTDADDRGPLADRRTCQSRASGGGVEAVHNLGSRSDHGFSDRHGRLDADNTIIIAVDGRTHRIVMMDV